MIKASVDFLNEKNGFDRQIEGQNFAIGAFTFSVE